MFLLKTKIVGTQNDTAKRHVIGNRTNKLTETATDTERSQLLRT